VRRIYYALFVLSVVGASVWVAIHYDVLALARAFLGPVARWMAGAARLLSGPLWQRAVFFGRPIVQNYLIRRAEAPIWTALTEGAVALIGYRALARVYARLQAGAAYSHKGFDWWKARHRLVRWSIGSGVIFGAGFFGFGLLILPMWVPLSGRIVQSVHFLWVDRVLNRWIAPARKRFRRTMRTNRFWRVARRPYRFLVYWLLLAVRKTAVRLRTMFARLASFEQHLVHH
jgi:hypothetical protein